MLARAARCRNWGPGTCDKHQTENHENQKFLVCQQGLQGAEIGTLGVVLRGLFNGVEAG